MISDYLKLQKRNLERDIRNLNIELALLDKQVIEVLKSRVILTEQLNLINKQIKDGQC